ncbi:MAG TPA: TonB-dependent receptor [Burkholderiaceae bacterium]|nr:TonB-dependent receptor [Burkholderiaceae bacterium]
MSLLPCTAAQAQCERHPGLDLFAFATLSQRHSSAAATWRPAQTTVGSGVLRSPLYPEGFLPLEDSRSTDSGLVAGTFAVGSPAAQALGAVPLKAETSRNLSLGLLWLPQPQWETSIDAYQIDIQDRILAVEHAHGEWRARLAATRYGSFTVPQNNAALDQTLGAAWVADASLGFKRGAWNVSVGVDNLTDRKPDPVSSAGNLNTNGIFRFSNFSPFGFNGRQYYARAGYSW